MGLTAVVKIVSAAVAKRLHARGFRRGGITTPRAGCGAGTRNREGPAGMIPKKWGYRFSEKIMLNKKLARDQATAACAGNVVLQTRAARRHARRRTCPYACTPR